MHSLSCTYVVTANLRTVNEARGNILVINVTVDVSHYNNSWLYEISVNKCLVCIIALR